MMMVVLAAVFQAAGWTVTPATVTVGDTVRLVRQIPASPDVVPRVPQLQQTAAVEPLSDPVVGYTEGVVRVVFTVAFFEPGDHSVAMPVIELLDADGVVERVPGGTARVTVASVLPTRDPLPDPKPSLGPLARNRLRPELLMAFIAASVALIVAVLILRQRRDARPEWRLPSYEPEEPRLLTWIRAGEPRAVVAAAADGLRFRIAAVVPDAGSQLTTDECMHVLEQQQPAWPLREIKELLRALDRARFAPAIPTDVIELAEHAKQLSGQLVKAPEGNEEA